MPQKFETPEQFRELSAAFMKSRVLLSAFELKVFTIIGNGSLPAAQVAAAAGSEPRATDRLLNVLCAMGLLTKETGLFTNTEAGRRFLVQSSPDYLSGLGHYANLYQSWASLTAAVRAGTSVRPSPADEGMSTEAFIAAMHQRALKTADLPVSRIDLTGVRRVLDVGGGSGVYAMAFVRASAELSVVLFDLPEVTALAEQYIAAEGLSGRITTRAGNYLEDDLGSGYDLVWLSAIVHINSFEENRSLVSRCAAGLNPGGHIAIQDHLMSEDRTAPPEGALFALNMLVNTQRGDTYTESEIASWFRDAGCDDIQKITTGPGPGMMIGRRI